MDERLVKYYGISHFYGSRFHRVSFAGDPAGERGGLLRQGRILTVTSYATRTSPAIRGIVRRAQAGNFRFSSLILGVVNSTPFQMRKTPWRNRVWPQKRKGFLCHLLRHQASQRASAAAGGI